jgi:addiction module RelB/DinJ family antitoxin
MSKTQLQVRVDEDIKKQAIDIFEKLGLNVSDAVNLFLRQSIYAKGIPFEVKIPSEPVIQETRYQSDYSKVSFTAQEKLAAVKASMAIEDMPLTVEEEGMLSDIQAGRISFDELRAHIINQYKETGAYI